MKTILIFLAAVLCVGQTKDTYPRINAGTGVHTAILNCTAAGANTTTYACSTVPSFTPSAGDVILFCPDVANTGASTLNVNAAGAKPMKQNQGQTPLVLNDLRAAPACVTVQYDGTNWDLQGQGGNAGGGSTPTAATLPWWVNGSAGVSASNVTLALGAVNKVLCSLITAPYPGEVVTNIYTFVNAGSGHMSVGFYDTSGNILTNGRSSVVNAPGSGPTVFNFATPPTLIAGTSYAACFTSDNAADKFAGVSDLYSGDVANNGLSAPNLQVFFCTSLSSVGVLPPACSTQVAPTTMAGAALPAWYVGH